MRRCGHGARFADHGIDLGEQRIGKAQAVARASRLGQNVMGAQRERLDRLGGLLLDMRRDDEHGCALAARDDFRQPFQTVPAGHLDIEQDDLDFLSGEKLKRLVHRGTAPGKDQTIVPQDDPLEHRAHHAAVIHHQNADRLVASGSRGYGCALLGMQGGGNVHGMSGSAHEF